MADTTASHWTGLSVTYQDEAIPAVDARNMGAVWFAMIGAPEREIAPPVVTVTPAASSTILRTDSLSFSATDDLGVFARIAVLVLGSTGATEVAFDGTAFSAAYSAGSSVTAISNGYDFVVARGSNGWQTSGVTIRILAIDASGNEASPIDYSYTVSNPSSAPLYFKMRGMDASTDGLYDTWVVFGLPDFAASAYAGSLATPLRDVVIDSSWSA